MNVLVESFALMLLYMQKKVFPLRIPLAVSLFKSKRLRLPFSGKHRRSLVLLSLLFLILSVPLSYFLLLPRTPFFHASIPLATPGTLTFTSSGEMGPANTNGFNDGVMLSLQALPPATAGTSYEVWLLPDQPNNEAQPLLIGTLPPPQQGHATLRFTSPDHQNLLARYSGVLVAQQATNPPPLLPSLDHAQWRYEGLIATTPDPNDPHHYSVLDHLRHLLASDPTLTPNGLIDGLDIWLYQNTERLLGWSVGARDGWTGDRNQESDGIHQSLVRVLDYLDGITYASQDVPDGTHFLADPQAAHFGLLNVLPTEDPPGYLPHVELHVQGLVSTPGHTSSQVQLAQTLVTELDTVAHHLQSVRADAQKLVLMSNNQLTQQAALNLLNDMATNATLAFGGEPNTATGTNMGGVASIQTEMQRLAVVPVSAVH